MTDLAAIVLAAGAGTRMKSSLPKVLHLAAGRPLVYYSVRAAVDAGAERVVVVASPETREPIARALEPVFGSERLTMVVQSPPRGTGDAARIGLEPIASAQVLILCGDTPLLRASELVTLREELVAGAPRIAILSAILDDPQGYGRVLRSSTGEVRAVREHRDLASPEEAAVREVNAGVYAADTTFLRAALARLTPANAQGEYYLPDVIGLAADAGGARAVVGHRDALVGVNDRAQLAEAEALLFARIARQHAQRGVTVRVGAYIDESVTLEPDALVAAGVHLRGATHVGRGASLDVGCVLTDVQVGEGAWVGAYTVGQGVAIPTDAVLPPHTRL